MRSPATCGVRLLSEMQQAEAEQTVSAPRKRGQPKKPRSALRHDSQEIIQAQPESAWQTVEWREGSRGTDAASNSWPSGSTPELAVLATVKPTDAAGPGHKAGCLGSARCWARKASPSGFSVACLQTPLCLAWWNWRICGFPIEQFYEDARVRMRP